MLDYRIRSFLAVIEEGTLQKASNRLCLTQPAVSQHLKGLEEEYGVPLFDHVGRRLVLNDAGEMLKLASEKAGMIFSKMERDMQYLIEGKRSYRIGATLTIGEFILPAYLGKYRQKNPNLDLSIRIENTESILRLLDRGEIDLALVEGPFEKDRYQSKLFLKDEMIFIGTDEYFGSKKKEVDKEVLEESRLILREPGSGTRLYWEEYLIRNQVRLSDSAVIMEVGSLSAIKALVESGFGCSVMSEWAVRKELLLGTIKRRELSWGPLTREMFFVYDQDCPISFIEDFIVFTQCETIG